MKKFKKPIIYCVEGVWGYDNDVEPSVEPMLEQLRRMGRWDYMRRDCATVDELKFYLKNEWQEKLREGSILYIAAHGEAGKIWLSEDESVGLDTLNDHVYDLRGCLVHFGCCSVMDAPDVMLRKFVESTEAMAMSGYRVDTGWSGLWAPALALELMYFNLIHEEEIDLSNGRHHKTLKRIVANLDRRFDDCKFMLKTKGDFARH